MADSMVGVVYMIIYSVFEWFNFVGGGGVKVIHIEIRLVNKDKHFWKADLTESVKHFLFHKTTHFHFLTTYLGFQDENV